MESPEVSEPKVHSDFIISEPKKVVDKLYVLSKHRDIMTAYYGSSHLSFPTMVLDVSKEDKTFICDGCHKNVLANVLESPKVMFKTEHLGAIVTFEATRLTSIEHEGVQAFLMPIPGQLRWREQREFYRMRIPKETKSYCQIVINPEVTIKLRLNDISIRGFSVFNDSEEISALLELGTKYEKSKLVIEGKEEMTVGFELRNKIDLSPNNPIKAEKIGCQFTLVTPLLEDAIRAYMMEIEREMLKKRAESALFAW
jgi:c-di-GMP-binding flagellar brake protein YcgR